MYVLPGAIRLAASPFQRHWLWPTSAPGVPAPAATYPTIVAEVDEQVVGFATLGRPVDGVLELEDLFVDPDAQRRGIGRALVAGAGFRAVRAGATRIDVTANPDALAFYVAVGFVVVGEAETRFGPAPRMALDIRDRRNQQS